MTRKSLRAIPSVDRIFQDLASSDIPRSSVVAVIRRELGAIRASRQSLNPDEILVRVRAALDDLRHSRLQPVINGTGILVHTNLGRSPLGPDVVRALSEIASNYNNLEYDLAGGNRGGRAAYLEHNLAVLCGAEAATVVNNCAAALVLILQHFTSGQRKQVVISRGELIQIGGGFRIPEILEASGAELREVGTTNKTSLSDYSRALSKHTAMILKVHRSNFYMGGFVDSPNTEELAALAHSKRLPFVEDLGSGATIRTDAIPDFEHEPTPAEVLARGVDLVCFSGDKLLGGPQAGIIAGRRKLVSSLKREPFFRALRCDKLILGALQETVDLHLRAPDVPGPCGVPVIDLLHASQETLRVRAEALADDLTGLPIRTSVGAGKSQIGGGTLPRSVIPSVTLDLLPESIPVSDLAQRLRATPPPVIGYISGGRFKLDLRTIFPHQDRQVADAIRAACRADIA